MVPFMTLTRDNKNLSMTIVESAAVAENIGYAHIGSSNEYKPYLFIMGG